MMMERDYELLYVIPNKYTDEEVPAITQKVDGLLKSAGLNLTKTENLGKRKLAYKIKQYNHGYYVLSEFKGASDVVTKIDPQLGLMPEVLRHSINHKVDVGLDAAKRARLAMELETAAPSTVEYKASNKPAVAPVVPGKKYVPDIEKELGMNDDKKAKAKDLIDEPPPEGANKVDMKGLDKKLDDILTNL